LDFGGRVGGGATVYQKGCYLLSEHLSISTAECSSALVFLFFFTSFPKIQNGWNPYT